MIISHLLLSNGAYPGPEGDYGSQNWFDAEHFDKHVKMLHTQDIVIDEKLKSVLKDCGVPDNYLGTHAKTPWISVKKSQTSVISSVVNAAAAGSQDEYSGNAPLQSVARKGYDRLVEAPGPK
jgi:hypothetical protein